MKAAIVKVLRERKGYVSGQELCETFQVSRTAVWKVMEQLKQQGYTIEAVRNKGYRLLGEPEEFSKVGIESRRKTKWAGKKILFLESTDSTNIQAALAGSRGEEEGVLVVAKEQVAGRGRRGRQWESPQEGGIYMSLLLRPTVPPDHASGITLLMALCVAESLQELTTEPVEIKWPNDIVMKGKKVCGILTEMTAQVDYIHYVVVGVGMNLNQTQFAGELSEKATSFWLETGLRADRSRLIAALLEKFEQSYEVFCKEGGSLSRFRTEYEKRLVNTGRPVRVQDGKESFDGIALGISPKGDLLVRLEDQSIRSVFAGEVSVRGIYGYI